MTSIRARATAAASADATFLLAVVALGVLPVFALVRPFIGGVGYDPRPAATGYAYTWLMLALFIPYAIAVHAVGRDDGPSLRGALIAATVLSLPLVAAPLIQSQDLFQYLDYARIQLVHHADPYVVPPDAFARDIWFRYVAWPDQLNVYGPVWSLAMAGVVSVAHGSVIRAMLLTKSVTLALEAVTVWGLIVLGRLSPERRVAVAVVAFTLNPLVLSSIALSGHADIAVAAAFVWAVIADRRDRPALAVFLLMSATLVKAYAGLALVAYVLITRRRGDARRMLRTIAPAAALALAAYVPYWRGLSTFDGLFSIATQTSASLAGAAARVLSTTLSGLDIEQPGGIALNAVRIAGVALMAVTIVWLVRKGRELPSVDPWPAAMTLMAVYVLITPWFLPWHAVGALALACAIPDSTLSSPARIFSGSCLATVGGPGLVRPLATSAVRYGPPAFSYLARVRTSRHDPQPKRRVLDTR